MAITIPDSINEKSQSPTPGEVRVFNLLRTLLPDTCYVWYEPAVDRKYPDFVILGPNTGIIVLEIKDWEIGSILTADGQYVELRSRGKKVENPLRQARDYARTIVQRLSAVPELRQKDGKYAGNLKFNWGYGVVFPRISKGEWAEAGFSEVVPSAHRVVKDDLDHLEKSRDRGELKGILDGMIPTEGNFTQLTPEEITKIVEVLSGDKDKKAVAINENGTIKHRRSTWVRFGIVAVCVILVLIGYMVWNSSRVGPTPKETFKASNVDEAKTTADQLIKGNVNDRGEKIYHMPGQKYYDKVKAEVLFKTEEEAIAAGYRKSKI